MAAHAADADAMLRDLLGALTREQQVPAQCRRWLRAGLSALALGEASTLEGALGLQRGRGQAAKLGRRLRLAMRDMHLCEALSAVAFDADATAWDRCARLSVEVRAFNRKWPALRLLQRPGRDWPAVRACLWRAAMEGLPLPESASALHRAAARNAGYSRSNHPRTIVAYATNDSDPRSD